MHTDIHTYRHTYISYLPTYLPTYVATYGRRDVGTYGRTDVRMYVCTYVRMYVCTYVRTYRPTYLHPSIHPSIVNFQGHCSLQLSSLSASITFLCSNWSWAQGACIVHMHCDNNNQPQQLFTDNNIVKRYSFTPSLVVSHCWHTTWSYIV